MRILLTQSEHSLSGLEPALLALGHEVVRWPLIRTVPQTDAATGAHVGRLAACRWVLFSSIAAVESWAASRPKAFGGQLYGAVGPGTAAAISAFGYTPTLVARGDARSLANEFLAHPQAAGPVGLPLGNRSSMTLPRRLERAGYEAVVAVTYRTELLAPPEMHSVGDQPDAVVLASPSAASALPSALARSTLLVAIGETTAAALRASGRTCLCASTPTVAGVLERLMTYSSPARSEA